MNESSFPYSWLTQQCVSGLPEGPLIATQWVHFIVGHLLSILKGPIGPYPSLLYTAYLSAPLGPEDPRSRQ